MQLYQHLYIMRQNSYFLTLQVSNLQNWKSGFSLSRLNLLCCCDIYIVMALEPVLYTFMCKVILQFLSM